MTHFDTVQVASAATSVTAATIAQVAPHPLQIIAWVVGILAGIYSIYRGYAADKRAIEQHERE